MAQPVTDREKLLRQARGLSYLRTGEVPRDDAFDSFNDAQLRLQIREYRTAINKNWDLDTQAEEADLDEPVSFGEQQPAAPIGTKDRLIDLITTELAEGSALPANDAMAVKSVMSVAGYDVDLDSDTFSAEEEAALARFNDNINMFSLEEMANRNFAAASAEEAQTLRLQQEQEALELSQAELKGSVASMLVYAGYLAPEDADNDRRIASAMNHAITIFSAHEDQVSDQQKMFVDLENWQLTDEAAIYLRTNMDGFTPQTADLNGELLRSHLDSGDPNLIKLAQGYLINQPGNEDVAINGILDQATYDAGLRELQTPIELPAGVYDTDGTIRGDRLMQYAVDGQLYLPVEMLSAEDRALYDSLPFAADRQPGDVNCKERLLASRLILEDPEGYARLLEQENARRATATLSDDNVVDLQAIAAENVVADVAVNQEALVASAALPSNFAEVVADYAAGNGGSLDVSEIPAILHLARTGDTLPSDQSLMTAEAASVNGAISPDDIRLSFELDPSSPEFAQNLEQVLKYAYVIENHSVTGADGNAMTVATIPAETAAAFKEIAETQTAISTTGTISQLQALELPANTLTALMDASHEGSIRLEDIPGALLSTQDPQFLMKLDPADPWTMLYRSNIYADGPQQPALQDIINNGELNLNDPAQLSVALQISLALKDNLMLEDVSANRVTVSTVDAMAHGYLGTNATSTPEDSAPATTRDGVEMSSIDLSRTFVSAHDNINAAPDSTTRLPGLQSDPRLARTFDVA